MRRSSIQMTVSLPRDLYRRAMQVAKKEFRSKSELVREALPAYVKEGLECCEFVSTRTL